MNNSAPLVITGMHRSGTSLVAGFVHEAGVDLGTSLVGPSRGNEYGHFEDTEMVDFHAGILDRQQWNMWLASSPPRTGDADRAKAVELVGRRREKCRWGWKDPRTCLFLDLWDSLLPNARYLFVMRHPLAVSDSLRRRDGGESNYWRSDSLRLNAWCMHMRPCFRFLRRHPSRAALVVLNRVVGEPEAFVRLLRDRFEIEANADAFRERFDPGALRRTVPWSRAGLLPIPFLRAMGLHALIRQQAAF